MAKGAAAKELITKKILETFEGSFMNGAKEIRIPMIEDGSVIQIKVALTCAKDNVPNPDGDSPIMAGTIDLPTSSLGENENMGKYMTEPTEQEKANVENLCKTLGLV